MDSPSTRGPDAIRPRQRSTRCSKSRRRRTIRSRSRSASIPIAWGPTRRSRSIQYLLEKHGKSPKLARRDGKPLIFGYQSVLLGIGYGMKLAERPEWKGKEKIFPIPPHFGQRRRDGTYLGEAMEDMEKHVGQPLYMHYCLSAFDYGVDHKDLTPGDASQGGGGARQTCRGGGELRLAGTEAG